MTKFTFKVSGEITDAQALYDAACAEAIKGNNENPEEWLRTNGEIDVYQCLTFMLLPTDDVPGVNIKTIWTDETLEARVFQIVKPKGTP